MFNSEEVKDNIRIVPKKGGNDMKLVKVEFKEQLDLIFKEISTGGEFRYREFDFAQDDQTEEEYKKAGTAFIGRLKHILGAYFPESTRESIVKFKGSNFTELCESALPIAEKAVTTGITVKLKLVLNNKGYVALPRFPTFISSEFKPADFSYNPQYDKLEIVAAKPDAESSSDMKEPTF